MEPFRVGLSIASLLSVLGNSALGAERDVMRSPCGRVLLTGANGFIPSHPLFGRRMYPRNHQCIWRIQAPPYTRILLFPTAMSVEYEKNCGHDRLEVFNGVNTSNPSNSLGTLCGADVNTMFVSSGSHMTILFHTDSTISKEGFTLRYLFVEYNYIPRNAARFHRLGRACKPSERKCGNGMCIPQLAVCDRFNDCGDQSDETGCVAAADNKCVYHSMFHCTTDKKCIPYHMKCDGVYDCPSHEDEKFCGEDGIDSPRTDAGPFDPTERATVQCGVPPIRPFENRTRIVGGQVVRPYSFPWTVSVRMNYSHVCGGSIVARNWVVTAAHCVEGFLNPKWWEAVSGLHYLYDETRTVQAIKVSRIVVHPRWDKNYTNYDLTLLQLKESFKWTKYTRPICLPTSTATGSKCYIAGWGATQGTGGAGYLKQGFVNTFTNKQCNEWYWGALTSVMICAGRREGGVDSCQGDSGGPLMCKINNRWVLHGATSFGGICGAAESPGVYARVAEMRRWIARYVK